MTREELLLTQLAEECCEVGKIVSKSLRFGLDDAHVDKPRTNRDRLVDEMIDVIALYKMLLRDRSIFDGGSDMVSNRISEKIEKVERYLDLSEQLGRLC